MGDSFENFLKELGKIEEAAPSEEKAKTFGKAEERAFKEGLENERLQTEILGLRQDIDERKRYAGKSFQLVSYWIGGVFLLLIFQGFFSEKTPFSWGLFLVVFNFKLSDSVLLAVVGGTTASVIGIFLVVANYLFPKR